MLPITSTSLKRQFFSEVNHDNDNHHNNTNMKDSNKEEEEEVNEEIQNSNKIKQQRMERKVYKHFIKEQRCIALIDLDCFFVAVERMLDPTLKDIPVGVAQYTSSETLIAISYEAKAAGVKRGMFGFQARKVCPNIKIVQVQTKNEKADLTRYRDASKKVLDIASRFCNKIERASVDEFYLDMTIPCKKSLREKSNSTCWDVETLICDKFNSVISSLEEETTVEEENGLLCEGTHLIRKIRMAIKEELGLDCSAGIAGNKFLAKSIAGIRKPAKQIVLPNQRVQSLCETMPLEKAKSLGGKLGEFLIEKFQIEFLGQISEVVGEEKLCEVFGVKEGKRLFDLGLGLDDKEVETRILPKSLGCSKTFPGKARLTNREVISEWLRKLVNELIERLQIDGRQPSTVTVGASRLGSRSTSSFPKSLRFTIESLLAITENLFDKFECNLPEMLLEKSEGGVTYLSLNLSGFPEEEYDELLQETIQKKWSCPMCTYENDSRFLRCDACGSGKSGLSQQEIKQKSIVSGEGRRKPNPMEPSNKSNGMKLFFPSATKLEEAPPQPIISEKQLTWTCHKCTYAENDLRFLRCEMCQSFKGLTS